MGITIIPAITPISGNAASIAGQGDALASSAGGGAIDFAALLGGQIADFALSAKDALAIGQPEKPGIDKRHDKVRDLINDLLAPQDPATTAQVAQPLTPQKIENSGLGDVDRNKPEKQSKEIETGISEPGINPNIVPVPAIAPQVTAVIAQPVVKDAALPQITVAAPAILAPGIADRAIAKELKLVQTNPPGDNKAKGEKFSIDLQSRSQVADIVSPVPEKLTPIQPAAIEARANPVQTPLTALPANPAPLIHSQPEAAANLAGETPSGNSNPPLFSAVFATPAAQQGQGAPNNNPTVNTPIQDKQWPHDFNERIVWIAKNDQQVAQINISPAQLGPVQITLNLNGDQANITFVSPHAEVRKAIEDALPNLREMLSTAGISLGQSNVGAQSQQQQRELPNQFANGNRLSGENAILPAESHSGSIPAGSPIQRGRGLVDLFA